MIQISRRSRNIRMTQLLRDNGDIHAFRSKLGSVGMAKAVGMNSLVNSRSLAKPFEHYADIRGFHGLAAQGAE